MAQPSDSEKQSILAQIIRSPGFKDSRRYQDLLQFLVEKSATAGPLKETEIAQAVFGKDSKFDPATDPLIRSYVSNLRKKLDHYYLTTEDQFDFVLEIPKGHYIVEYSPAAGRINRKGKGGRLTLWYPIVIALLVIIVVVLMVREFEHRTSSAAPQARPDPGPLWSEFTQSGGRPAMIVLGDFFFMRERGNTDGYYRKGKINNLDEYLEYIRQNPEFGQRYARNNFTFLRPSAPWGLMSLLPILQNVPNGISLKLASQFTSDDFKTHNVVFIGSFKTLYVLKNFLHIFKLEYSTIPPSSFRVQDGIGDSLHVFRPERLSAGNLEKDYGVVAKGHGPDGSCILVLLGFSESGVIQAVHAASDPGLFKTIEEQYPDDHTMDAGSLTIVVAAEGMTQSLFKPEIIYIAGVGPPRPASMSRSADSAMSLGDHPAGVP